MRLFEVEYYGVLYEEAWQYMGIELFKTKSERKKTKKYSSVFFKVNVIPFYKGKKNVLRCEFEDGMVEYETLFEPNMFYDINNGWQKSNQNDLSREFWKMYCKGE